jgi:hypothetical protein
LSEPRFTYEGTAWSNVQPTSETDTWRESGLGAPEDIDKLRRRITELEQTVVDLTRQLDERGEELDAARAANREMIAQMNTGPGRRPPPAS